MQSQSTNDQGAVLIQVAVALLALLALSAFVVDYGVMWASRGQAQTAADAGALAGALSLAFDSPTDQAGARATAIAMAGRNRVWGAAPSVTDPDVTFPVCPPGAPGLPDTCVKVEVFRNQTRQNPLPMFFGRLAGIEAQGVRATATAQIMTGNATDCLKPWAVADKWEEHWENKKASTAPWTPTSTFDKYAKDGTLDTAVTTPDVYIAPTATSPGTGFMPFDANGNPTADYGLQIVLKIGDSKDRLSAGWFQALDLPNPDCPGGGGSLYGCNIANCNPTVYAIGETVSVSSEQGNMVGPTQHGVEGGGQVDIGLTEKDSGAVWNTATKSITGSCAPGICADGNYYARSPRIVPVALFNLDAFFAGTPNGKTTITISNIMGFFVEGMSGRDVVGRLVAIPGTTKGTNTVDESASFLRKILLVR